MSEEQLWSIPDDVESIYIHYTTEDLLKGFREEALIHRKEIERLNNKIEKALLHIDILQELIYKQPSNNAEEDVWILDKLDGIKFCLKESDKECTKKNNG